MSRFVRSLLAAAAVLTVAAPAAVAAQAPGRVVLPPAFPAPVPNVDAAGAGPAVALPDGGIVLAGRSGRTLVLTQLRRDGTPEPGFGDAGTSRLLVPGGHFSIAQLIRRPDGRLLAVGVGAAASRFELPRLTVVGLTPQGRLDDAFGQGGVARPAVQASCGGCAPAALQADGSILLAGSTGQISPAIATDPNAGSTFRWVVVRLTAAGTQDPGFGAGGVATIPAGQGRNVGGFAVGQTATGRVLSVGRGTDGLRIAGLTATGAMDPTYNGGAPVPVALNFAINAQIDPTGRVDVIAGDRIRRYTPTGQADAGFGQGGQITFEPTYGGFAPQVLPTGDGGLLVAARTSYEPRRSAVAGLRVRRFGPTGAPGATTAVNPGFGGGFASFRRSTRLGLGLGQDSFGPGELVRRPDGSFALAGGVRIVRYTGEGAGRSIAFFAAASLTPSLGLETTFGGPAVPARVGVAVPPQRAASGARLRRVVVQVSSSAPGLALLRVRDGRRRILAQSLEPVYGPGTTTVRVPLTSLGRRVLARGRPVRVTVGHAFRDVVRSPASGSRVARLR